MKLRKISSDTMKICMYNLGCLPLFYVVSEFIYKIYKRV
jgi:hypothetical protein